MNRRIAPESDLRDIRVVLQYTPLYCVLISSVYDMQLANQFAEITDILQVEGNDEGILQAARNYAEQSGMAVLIVGEAGRLDEVKDDGSTEALC